MSETVFWGALRFRSIHPIAAALRAREAIGRIGRN